MHVCMQVCWACLNAYVHARCKRHLTRPPPSKPTHVCVRACINGCVHVRMHARRLKHARACRANMLECPGLKCMHVRVCSRLCVGVRIGMPFCPSTDHHHAYVPLGKVDRVGRPVHARTGMYVLRRWRGMRVALYPRAGCPAVGQGHDLVAMQVRAAEATPFWAAVRGAKQAGSWVGQRLRAWAGESVEGGRAGQGLGQTRPARNKAAIRAVVQGGTRAHTHAHTMSASKPRTKTREKDVIMMADRPAAANTLLYLAGLRDAPGADRCAAAALQRRGPGAAGA